MIIHFIHHPVSALKFVEPLVQGLNKNNFKAELWMENRKGLEKFTDRIACPRNFCDFDISLNPLRFTLRCLTLVKKLKESKPQAIHAHQSRAALIPLLTAKICKVPIRIYNNHGLPYIGYKGFLKYLLFLLEKINCCLATDVITVAPDLKKIIENDLNPPNGCHIIANGSACGIDLNQFPKNSFTKEQKNIYRHELNIPEKSFVMLFCGRPVKRKGIDILFKAWENAQIKKDKVLLLAGIKLSDLKGTLINNESIKPVGFVLDMRKLYCASDVVVLPSFHEGVSYTILEALACFRTVVATDIPGNSYIIKDKINGFLIPPGNWIILKKRIEELAESENLNDLNIMARKTVEENFDREYYIKSLIEFYSGLKL